MENCSPRIPLVLALSLAGCSHTQSPAPPRSAPVTVRLLVDGSEAKATADALGRASYLRLQVVDGREILAARAGPAPADRRLEVVASARAALQAARESYRKLRFAETLERLRKAETALAEQAATAEELSLLGELALQRALNHLALEQPEQARAALSLAIVLGERGLAPGQLPPRVESFISQTRVALAAGGTRGVRVDTEPVGAAVFVDGKKVGSGPVRTLVPVGTHHLRAEALGFEPRGRLIVIEVGEPQRIHLVAATARAVAGQLLGRSRVLAGEPGEERFLAKVLASAPAEKRPLAWLDVQSEAGGGQQADLLWMTGSAPPARLHCKGAGLSDLAACLGPLLYRASSGEKLPAEASSSKREGHTPFYRSWWFWTLVGAGVAGGVTAGAVAGTRRSGGVRVSIESLPAGLRAP